MLKLKKSRTSTWEKRLEEIQEEWRKHEILNTCSICDSPKGHTEIKEFVREQKEKSVREGYILAVKDIQAIGIKKVLSSLNPEGEVK